MIEFLDALHALGTWSTAVLWLPVLTWTLLALPFYVMVQRAERWHPLVRYRLLQALLFTLPAGLVAAAWIDASSLLAGWTSLSNAPAGPAIMLLPAEGAVTFTSADSLVWSAFHAVGLFTVGALLFSAVRLARLARSRWAVAALHGEALAEDSGVQQTTNRLACDLGVQRPVQVQLTDETVVPLTYGTRRPVILLPRTIAEVPDALKMTLTHELVHIRRFDFLARWAEQLMAAAFAIHPGLPRLVRAIEIAREKSCDAEALRHLHCNRRDYADLLYGFSTAAAPHPAFAVSIAETSSSLKERIHAMTQLNMSDLKTPRYAFIAALALLISLGLGIVACSDAVTPPNASEGNSETVTTQSEDAPEGPVFVVVEDRPELKGGMTALQEAIQYPESAKEAGIEGRVFVQFIVDENGDVLNPTVTRGAHESLDQAALEAVKGLSFEPGKQRGKPVKVQMALPVTFKLPKGDATTTSSANQSASQAEAGPLEADNRQMSFQQLQFGDNVITGRVVDAATGQPLAGTNIHVPNTNKGSVTGTDGSFTLRAADASSIVASFVGYESIEAHR